jgi:hypothetical protein
MDPLADIPRRDARTVRQEATCGLRRRIASSFCHPCTSLRTPVLTKGPDEAPARFPYMLPTELRHEGRVLGTAGLQSLAVLPIHEINIALDQRTEPHRAFHLVRQREKELH